MDLCQSVEEVMDLHREMTVYFTGKMEKLKKERVFSRPVIQCINYIEANLHHPIRIQNLAEHVSLNPTYLATIFKKKQDAPLQTIYCIAELIQPVTCSVIRNTLLPRSARSWLSVLKATSSGVSGR